MQFPVQLTRGRPSESRLVEIGWVRAALVEQKREKSNRQSGIEGQGSVISSRFRCCLQEQSEYQKC